MQTARHPLTLWGPMSGTGLGAAAAALLIDQAHKWWMLQVFDIAAKKRVAVLPFLDLVHAINPGVSYSLFEQRSPIGQAVLAAFAALVACGLAIWIARTPSRLTALSLGLIMGGALGNALDRLTLGGVADFFLFHAFGLSWYVFKLADVAIVAGVIGLVYEILLASRKRAPNHT